MDNNFKFKNKLDETNSNSLQVFAQKIMVCLVQAEIV